MNNEHSKNVMISADVLLADARARIASLEADLAEAVRMLFSPTSYNNDELRKFNLRPNVRAIIERDPNDRP